MPAGVLRGGGGTITRCASTLIQDSVARNVRNDALDRFCLNGNKLRLVAGTYGAAGSEYRTEFETYQRIKAYGVAGNGPQYFFVEGRDGLTYEYGNTSNSRIESVGQATARAWALNRIRDRDNNEIVFTYDEDLINGSYKLDLVSYGGNPTQGSTASYTIDLVYEPKPSGEVDSGYLAGSVIKETQRLDRVDVWSSGSTLYRRYDLAYEAALSTTSRSRLASITECAGATLDCLAPTLFTYQDGSPLNAEASTSTVVPVTSVLPMDVNGDGREDLVYSSSSGAGQWMVMFANAAGGYNTPINTTRANTGQAGAIPIDYNADGKMDLLVPYSGGTWWYMLGSASGLGALTNTGVSATGTGSNARALDVDGDGQDDLVWVDLVATAYAAGDALRWRRKIPGAAFSTTVNTLVGPLPVNNKISASPFAGWAQRKGTRKLDTNGDGRSEVIYQIETRIPGTRSIPNEPGDPDTFLYSTVAIDADKTTYSLSGDSASNVNYFGDFNGDGKIDVFYKVGSSQWYFRLSNGNGFAASQSAGSLAGFATPLIYDWDGDGADDVLAVQTATSTWYVLRSTREALLAPISTGIPATGTNSHVVTDLNGDQLPDLAYRDAAGVWRYRTRSVIYGYPDLLATATDGFGVAATFAYAPTTSGSVYTSGTGAAYPLLDYQQPLWVVSSLSATDGTGNNASSTVNYTYEGARVHLTGRGFLGFAKRTSVDTRLGYNLKTIETYLQDFPFIGATASVEQQQSSGTPISIVQNTCSKLSWGTAGDTLREFPYVSASTSDQHEVGLSNGTKLRTVATSVAATGGIDATSGLITDLTTTTTEVGTGLFPGSYKTERTQQTVVNDTSSWCLGRPTATSQTSSHTLNCQQASNFDQQQAPKIDQGSGGYLRFLNR